MSWTVVQEDEDGSKKKTMSSEFNLSDSELIYNTPFRLLKYLDPYGDTTFNALMFEDLINDLTELKNLLPADRNQIDSLISFTKECKDQTHVYLKFYGD